MIIRHVLFSVLAFAMVSASYAQSDSYKAQGKSTKQTAKSDQRGTEEHPLVIKGFPATKGKQETEEETKQRAEQSVTIRGIRESIGGLERESERTTILTLLLFIAAACQIGLFWWQLRLIASTVSDTRKSAEAAERIATATMASVGQMRDTAQRQLRAYLCIAGGQMRFPSPDAPEAEVMIKNFGQTPAYNVRQWIHMWITDHPLRAALPEPPQDFKMSVDVLGPGSYSTMLMPKQPPVPAASIPLLGTSEGTIFIYGEVRYRDVFGKDRFTKYRLIYGGQAGVHDGRLKPDSEGNEAD